MSDNNVRSGTTKIDQSIDDARREADEIADRDRVERLNQEIEQGKRERIADRADATQEEIENIRQEVARKSRAEERREAWNKAPGHALLLMLIFLICYLIAAATGRPNIITFPGSRDAAAAQQSELEPSLNDGGLNRSASGTAPTYQVAAVFNSYYNQVNGARMFGRPISDVVQVNGRESQWFERARLESWPENRGTKYEVQPALVGVEYTQGLPFPNQQFFVSNPEVVYAPITNHGVSDRFNRFWNDNGGLDLLGYPISDELQELLPTTGKVHTVQYFERGRLEYHPEEAGTANEIMIGLLGRALYLNDNAPNIVSAAKPTPVPVP